MNPSYLLVRLVITSGCRVRRLWRFRFFVFSTRQGVSKFSDFGVVAIWQGHDHVMDGGFWAAL